MNPYAPLPLGYKPKPDTGVLSRALHLPSHGHYVGTARVSDNHATVEAATNSTQLYTFFEYLDACRRVRVLQSKQLREEREQIKQGFVLQSLMDDPDRAFLAHYSSAFTPDLKGYTSYQKALGEGALLDHSLPVHIPESARTEHTYLVGATGYGKSELLKAFVHSYVTEPECAVVVIDPAGDFVRQIAHWKEFVANRRIVYFDPTLGKGMTPTINPLQTPFVNDTSERAVHAKQVHAQQLLAAFEQVIAGGLGSAVSLPMRALLMPCILTLLDLEGATLLDLQRFMDDSANFELINFGATRTHYTAVAPFFQAALNGHGFRDRRFNITKGSILTKLQELFNTGFFIDLTCAESTINLPRAIKKRKVILFNLAKGKIGDDESQAFGRLIVAMLQGMVMREGNVRTPIHLFIDECHNFITPAVRTIMLETRKFKLYLTLAQQIVGEGMTGEMRTVITGSANLHITGYAQPLHQYDAARLVGVQPEQIAQLDKGDFYVRMGRHAPFRFRARSDLLGFSNNMTDPAWKRLVARQLRAYYRPRYGSDPMPEEPEAPPLPDTDAPQAWG